ncbi:hypothetical protein [Meiothermus rufus]|uniref:hypothetical protein n=1 Tax=Meiothermus rufus TaxID=604332 RepID=UPI0004130EF3|nr:hypothetical protein [Meiothermus rufus]
MFTLFNALEMERLAREKVALYQQEARGQGLLPKRPLRRQLAGLLRGWAEALEPTPPAPRPLRDF